jgi:hypothetical protein
MRNEDALQALGYVQGHCPLAMDRQGILLFATQARRKEDGVAPEPPATENY